MCLMAGSSGALYQFHRQNIQADRDFSAGGQTSRCRRVVGELPWLQTVIRAGAIFNPGARQNWIAGSLI
jgi:hypothetical protein